MSDIPEVKNPKRVAFDMGRYSDELAGLTINVLQNPTRGFRQSFVKSAWNASVGVEQSVFRSHLAVVLGVDGDDGVQAAVDDLPDDAFHWLFLYTLDGWSAEAKSFATMLFPYLLTIWDDYVTEQVKARAARESKSSLRGEKNEEQVKTND